MERKTSELTKTFSRTSTSGEHDKSLEGRLGVEEKLRYPSTSYFKVVLGLGHNFKEEGTYQVTEGGVQGALALMSPNGPFLTWRHPSTLSFLVCLLFLTLQVHRWAGDTAVFRSVEMLDSASAFSLASHISMKDLSSELTFHPK